MISDRLLKLVRCPECHGRLTGGIDQLRCQDCEHTYGTSERDFLVLSPDAEFAQTTKFLDEHFHSDGRDEVVSPPLLSAGVRQRMLVKFLGITPEDTVADLGCGSGRFAVWNRSAAAQLVGVDAGTFFAAEARQGVDLVVGDLRQLPLADDSVTKAYTVDVLEHLSREGLERMLGEAARVLAPGGALFVYTHVRQRSVLAPIFALISRLAAFAERTGLANLDLERLRPTDHLNPLGDRADLEQVAAAAGFRVARFRWYSPIVSRITEGILVPVAAQALARRVTRRSGNDAATPPDLAARRAARLDAKRRLAAAGPVYQVLRALTWIAMADVTLLGRVPSGPFFALLVREGTLPDGARRKHEAE